MDVGDKVMDAERAAFEAWVASKGDADIAWLEREPRHGFYINLTVSAWWTAWQAARRTPSASIGEDGLPELSEGRIIALWNSTESGGMVGRYVRFAHAVAREAVTADRRAREDVPTWADVQAREREIRELQSQVIDLRAQLARQSQSWELAGREVSVAIDTGDEEYDKGKRIFAMLTGEVASDGKTLIADEVSRNFAAPPLSSEPQGDA